MKQRIKVHRKSKVLDKIINQMETHGFYYYNKEPFVVVDASKDGEFLNLTIQHLHDHGFRII
jgi:hypothetical protein